MEWTDEAIVLGVRRHGEANAILELMTRQHGRHLGLVRGGSGTRMRPVLQPGNSVSAVWRARLDEHLGHYAVEGLRLRAGGLLTDSQALYGIAHLTALVRLLPERDPHPMVYGALEAIVDHLGEPGFAASLVVRFELLMLTELGFGLDLGRCAATGETSDLIYVSPKSGRAVSRAAGEAWQHKLLRLPTFLSGGEDESPPAAEVDSGFALTGFFLSRYVLEPRGLLLSDARAHFIAAVTRALPQVA
jgi:DNA repair protein RecO (recombination protein O)